MIYLVNGATKSLDKLPKVYKQHFGRLIQPRSKNTANSIQQSGMSWAADNDCFSKDFCLSGWWEMLDRIVGVPNCLFIVCPDSVGDAEKTLRLFRKHVGTIRRTKQPVAFVGQDGLDLGLIPWEEFDAYFVGGSTKFKLSELSHRAVREAKKRSKWVHMGRVNSIKRIKLAFRWGCDSVDGTSVSMYPDVYLNKWGKLLHSLKA